MLETILIVALVYCLIGAFLSSRTPFFQWYFADKELSVKNGSLFILTYPWHFVQYIIFLGKIERKESIEAQDHPYQLVTAEHLKTWATPYPYDPSASVPESDIVEENLNAGYFPKSKPKKKSTKKQSKPTPKKLTVKSATVATNTTKTKKNTKKNTKKPIKKNSPKK